MTTPRYQGCTAGSQVGAEAWSPDHAWYVSFNNGNANNNHRDNNNACVRAVRSVPSGECQGAGEQGVPLRALYKAWRVARRGKKPSRNQLAFDVRWADGLLRLQRELEAGTWRPRPSTSFIATRPKAREIHAPDFADRVMHHWLVPQLEAIYERRFIHDSYANRRGKGSHAAVRRLQSFVRQMASGQGGGWYLQLDIHNYFNSIHRARLWHLLKPVLVRAGLPMPALRATHALLRRGCDAVHVRATAAELAMVPPHKRLANAPAGCGLPVGNLSSQFFANVYLDRLDQFVKHTLKAKRYLRYVDDFVLVHRDRAVLERWQADLARFLAADLRLSLKADMRLRRIEEGIDFLGYIIRPTHTLVRRRVVAHARQAFAEWESAHVRGTRVRATPAELRALQSTAASYGGHLRHANAFRLRRALRRRFPWLAIAARKQRFHRTTEGKVISLRTRIHASAAPMKRHIRLMGRLYNNG